MAYDDVKVEALRQAVNFAEIQAKHNEKEVDSGQVVADAQLFAEFLEPKAPTSS